MPETPLRNVIFFKNEKGTLNGISLQTLRNILFLILNARRKNIYLTDVTLSYRILHVPGGAEST
jgi:hypothetical protein